jgi:hypothetical protein
MKAWIIGFGVVVLLAACATMGAKGAGDGTPTDAFAGYPSWRRVNAQPITGDASGALGRAHEGASGYRNVFVNATGEEVATSASGYPYPEGTILVKESRKTADGAITNLTVMIKREATYDPDNGNWEYVMTSPTLEVASQGKLSMCIGCHAAGFEQDFTFNDTYAR